MTNPSLGRLVGIDVRAVWESEPRDFTAWLAEAENLSLLGDTLGLELELEARERSVGPFAADIVAKDFGQDLTVVIENQLEPTDHKHLGQIVTYAAGVQANAVVWIAPEFRDEHRAAIDWLNRASAEGFYFFGVQIEAYKIGDSLPAPRFNVVAKPNTWVKKVAAGRRQAESEPNDSKQRWSAYWNGLQVMAQQRFPMVSHRATSYTNWQSLVSVSKTDDLAFKFHLSVSRDGLRAELYIDGRLAKAAFRSLERDSDQFERALGAKLVWDLNPEAKSCRISTYMPGQLTANYAQPKDQYEWFINNAPRFVNTLMPAVEKLSPQILAQDEQATTEG